MKIYTKTGDQGKTGLFGGKRVTKGHLRIESYGTVDELNSHIGLLRDQEVLQPKKEELITIQNNLFVLGSLLASDPDAKNIKVPDLPDSAILDLEKSIDDMDSELPPMRNFVLPGGHVSVSYCHIARCVCRRTERLVVRLSEEEAVSSDVIKYLNRLSDYLFTLARWITLKLDVEETPWVSGMS